MRPELREKGNSTITDANFRIDGKLEFANKATVL